MARQQIFVDLADEVDAAQKLSTQLAASAQDVRDRAALSFIFTVLTRMQARMRRMEADQASLAQQEKSQPT